VWQKRIKQGKIGIIDMHRRRSGQLVLRGDGFQHLVDLDGLALGQTRPQCIIDEIQAFVLSRVQQLEILLHRGSFRRILEQLIIGHAEAGRGIHVAHVLVVDKRTRLADQRVDHVAKVDVFLLLAELSRYPLDAFVPIPQFQMVLVNADFKSQADVLAVDGIDVSLHADDAVGLHRHGNRGAGTQALCGQRAERRGFFTEASFSRGVAATG
jgi:hypothetical protein